MQENDPAYGSGRSDAYVLGHKLFWSANGWISRKEVTPPDRSHLKKPTVQTDSTSHDLKGPRFQFIATATNGGVPWLAGPRSTRA
jgi:hypothetical protein